jgi:hypothetical protein
MRYTEEANVSSNDSDMLGAYYTAEVSIYDNTIDVVTDVERPIVRSLATMDDVIYMEALE